MIFSIFQIKLFCLHPVKQVMMENKLEVHKDKTLKEAVEMAYKVCLIVLFISISQITVLTFFPKLLLELVVMQALAVMFIAHLQNLSLSSV